MLLPISSQDCKNCRGDPVGTQLVCDGFFQCNLAGLAVIDGNVRV